MLIGPMLLLGPTSCTPGANPDPPSAMSAAASSSPSAALAAFRGGPELSAKLAAAVAAKGNDYRPRTKHFREDGTAKYTNRLILQSSPYLLQHAHNPVNWFPWGDEAFALAKSLGRPVFLSIGYSTCHWCHVMEEESFEDEAIAAYINDHYVPVKVDREQRPDVDAVYMHALQMMAGRGGWPMSMWLTAERKPFWAGTYMPPRDGDRGRRKGFLTVLTEQADRYRRERETIETDASKIASRVRADLSPAPARDSTLPTTDAVIAAVGLADQRYDEAFGGIKGAPKFPSSFPVRLLLQFSRRTADARPLQMALKTLTKMAHGGMYDQLGGGFHRYSTDRRWLVPHFEKMLYDNALLVPAYLEAYRYTGDPEFRRIAVETLEYVLREMTSPKGPFYSATDADSPTPSGKREEGWFFTWTPPEVEQVLAPDEAAAVVAFYGVELAGNFEGRSILHRRSPVAEVAAKLDVTPEELTARLERARPKLLAARNRRPPPLRDDKILFSWNGLMIEALAQAGLTLGEPRFTAAAVRAANYLETEMRRDGRWVHAHPAAPTAVAAFAEDHAFAAQGMLSLFQANEDERWLKAALAHLEALEREHRSPNGAFFRTAPHHEALIAREVDGHDGAIPSASSVALLAQLTAARLTADDVW
ncbi:MAG: thioredoxin domain-containing protein, partial [Myxococcota bacterium]